MIPVPIGALESVPIPRLERARQKEGGKVTLLGQIKRIVNRWIAPLTGHVLAHESVVPSFERFARRLRAAGLDPRTVFDIGVAEGTPWLYQAFPNAHFVLIDPTREALPYMRKWAQKLDAEIWNFALGDQEGVARINVRSEIGGSTFYEEIGEAEIVRTYDVIVRRFDDVVGEIVRPSICKIDVQGAELRVLRGMHKRISEIDVILCEASLIATIKSGPEIGEVFEFMREVNFVLYDIVGITRRPLDHALAQVDLVYVPAGSPLRSDRRWSR